MSTPRTPGARSLSQTSRQPIGGRASDVVAIVLGIQDRRTATARWFDGQTCDVLLLDTFRVLPDVIISTLGGGWKNSLAAGLSPTDEDLRQQVYDASHGEGIMPDPRSGDRSKLRRWGSWVSIGWLNAAGSPVPYIVTGLQHPGADGATTPTWAGSERSVVDSAVQSAESGVAAPDVYIDWEPPEITQLEAPAPRTFGAYGTAGPLREAYLWEHGNGWRYGASNGWSYGRAIPLDVSLPLTTELEKAEAAGYQAGYALGNVDGIALRTRYADEAPPPAEYPSWEQPEADDSAYESEDHDAPTVPGDGGAWRAAGNRIVLTEAGLTIDSTETGPITLQAQGSAGVLIQCSGAKLRIGNVGKSVSVEADDVVIDSGNIRQGSAAATAGVALAPATVAAFVALTAQINAIVVDLGTGKLVTALAGPPTTGITAAKVKAE